MGDVGAVNTAVGAVMSRVTVLLEIDVDGPTFPLASVTEPAARVTVTVPSLKQSTCTET